MNKKVIAIIVAICIVLVGVVIFAVTQGSKEEKTAVTNTVKDKEGENKVGNLRHATIVVKDFGTIKLELYPDIAPITVASFIKLASFFISFRDS